MKYKINEVFETLQGEGRNQGKHVVFIRFSGCNMQCSWCDTDHSQFQEYDLDTLVSQIEKYNIKSVILTGGEPTIYNLLPLLKILKSKGFWIGIETNGSISLDNIRDYINYISMSPKGHIENFRCNELRVVNDSISISKLLEYETLVTATDYFISPLDRDGYINIKETLLILGEINEISSKKWRISLQLHKFAGIK